MFKPFPQELNLPAIEEEVLHYWKSENIFQKSVTSRPADKPFVFFEGPPTANGKPGIHHVIARTMKDFGCRLKTMQGYRVERKAGWDTHGLPVEIEVEKQLKFTKKDQILAYGIDKFNARCRESVWQYKQLWDQLTERMGYWVDLNDPYVTYENKYIESVWWILKQFWDRNLLYRGHKIVPYCPRCETPLSSHEVAQGYDEVEDPSVFVKMPLQNDPSTSFLVWTTTPWTLISNVALALHPDVTYVKVSHKGEHLILAEPRLEALTGDYQILERKTGRDYANIDYQPIFTFMRSDKRSHYTVLADFVTTTDGTGIVHLAPAFGQDDYQVGMQHNLPFYQPIDKSGRFTAEVTAWQGQFFKEADPGIVAALQQSGRLYKIEKYRHTYPHCWRDDTPLIYYAKETWYIRTTQFKDRFVELNKEINWYPPEVGAGRFGEWLANNVDWALSRDRFWGTPLPIWLDEEGNFQCVGSVNELAELAGRDLAQLDLHRPFVDEITFLNPKNGKLMRRTPEVIDVWFDSGAMPLAQWHYPFENKDVFARSFPADFISEAVDQTRGWFYSLLAIAAMLFDKPCFKNCVVLEMVLDKDGKKMSKSKGNVVDPFQVINKFGADATRWYMMTVNPPWQTTRFDTKGVEETVSRFFGTLINTYAFFAMYANIDKFEYPAQPIPVAQRPEIDRWLVSTLNRLVARVEEHYNVYDVTRGARALAEFVVDDLSNWYVRRCRRRFWKSDMGSDKQAAFETLYEALLAVCKCAAPLAPFIPEAIYLRLTGAQPGASVHLSEFPSAAHKAYQFRQEDLETQMEAVRTVVNAGRALRAERNLKIRQPLSRIIIVSNDEKQRAAINTGSQLIQDELNVKAIEFVTSAAELTSLKAEPNFKSLGPKFGKQANAVAGAIRALRAQQAQELEQHGVLEIDFETGKIKLATEDVNLVRQQAEGLTVSTEAGWTIALDTKLNDDLLAEGLARDFVNRVQNMRKDAGFEVTDRIAVRYEGSSRVHDAIQKLAHYIQQETLADRLGRAQAGEHLTHVESWTVGDEKVVISVARV